MRRKLNILGRWRIAGLVWSLGLWLPGCNNALPARAEAQSVRPSPQAQPPAPSAVVSGAAASPAKGPGCSAPSVESKWRVHGRGRQRVIDEVGSSSLRKRQVTIFLPQGYERETDRRYPVLYVHDGQYAFQGGFYIDQVLDELARDGIVEPHIVVAIDRTQDRSRELKPSRWPGSKRPSLERYSELLVQQLKPFIDAQFRTRCERSATSVLGYSLGGLANLYLAMHHPEVFGRIACMSPSFWWRHGAMLEEFRAYEGKMPDRLWIDAGTAEGRRSESLPYFVRDIRAARDMARAKGMILGRDLGYLEDPRAPHADWAGARRMRYVLAFLLAERRPVDAPPTAVTLHMFRDSLGPEWRETHLAVTTAHAHLFRLTWPNDSIRLTSLQPQVARMEEGGVVHAVAPGVALIEASIGGLSDVGSIVVRDSVRIRMPPDGDELPAE